MKKLFILMILAFTMVCSTAFAWLSTEDLPAAAITIQPAVNLRATAYVKGKIVAKLEKGVGLTIVGITTAKDGTEWYEVDAGDYHGFVRHDLVSTDADVVAAVQANAAAQKNSTAKTASGSGKYIGNKNTKALHRSSCSHLPAKKNRVYFSSKEKAIKSGYTNMCNYCHP